MDQALERGSVREQAFKGKGKLSISLPRDGPYATIVESGVADSPPGAVRRLHIAPGGVLTGLQGGTLHGTPGSWGWGHQAEATQSGWLLPPLPMQVSASTTPPPPCTAGAAASTMPPPRGIPAAAGVPPVPAVVPPAEAPAAEAPAAEAPAAEAPAAQAPPPGAAQPVVNLTMSNWAPPAATAGYVAVVVDQFTDAVTGRTLGDKT